MILRESKNRFVLFCTENALSFFSQLKITAFFAYFEIKKASAGNGLGLVWMFLEPLLRVMIYVFVFTVVFNVRLPNEETSAFSYAVYILSGLIPWIYISSVLMDGVNLVHSYAGFIRQPRFPYRILPNVILLKHLPSHIIGMVVLMTMVAISGDIVKINFALLIVVYVLMILVVRGIATFLGACAAVLPDVQQVLNLMLMLAIYLSPIFYVPAMLGKFIVVGMLNPFSYVLTSFKYALTGDVAYTMFGPWGDLSVLVCLAIFAMTFEQWVLKRIRFTGIDRVV